MKNLLKMGKENKMVSKDLIKRGYENFNDKYHYSWLGKKLHTLGLGNWLWIMRHENGAKIRKRNEGIIVLNNNDLHYLAFEFKDLAGLHTEFDLDIIAYKYPKTKGFIERLKKGKVDYTEMEAIKKGYETKVKIVEALGKENK